MDKFLLLPILLFSFLSNAEQGEIQIGYDKSGQIELTYFDASVNPTAKVLTNVIKNFTNDKYRQDFRNAPEKEATWLISKLKEMQGKVNFTLSGSLKLDLRNKEEKGLRLCIILEQRDTASTHGCALSGSYLDDDMTIVQRNKLILDAMHRDKIAAY